MRQITELADMQAFAREQRTSRRRLALVPTMGFLHQGHLSLVRAARDRCPCVVVSIFVNPTQFGPNEDLDRYPRDLPRDLALLEPLGVDVVFTPEAGALYPPGRATWITVDGLTAGLCGRSRPTHFRGVTTVVGMLFNLVQPDVAVFGQKDYQQLAVIRRMARDLHWPIEIVGGPTVREADGLAMSSRNAYLSPEERAAAPALSRALRDARQAFQNGERRAATILAAARQAIEASGLLRIDYIELVDPDDLTPLPAGDAGHPLPDRVHMAVAAFAGKTRLIDNLRLSADQP